MIDKTPPSEHQKTSFLKQNLIMFFIVAPFIFGAVVLIIVSGPLEIGRIGFWFDSIFFQYNVLLVLTGTLFVPIITYAYIKKMKPEKMRRLEWEIPRSVWVDIGKKDKIISIIETRFNLGNYVGSVLLIMTIVLFGLSILTLLKPIPNIQVGISGLDYEKGANILLLGPFMEYFPHDKTKYYHQIILSLTAFQFGFLGAYTHFIGNLVRSYFMLDLTPHTYIESAIRMVIASVLSLVLAFWFAQWTVPLSEQGQVNVMLYALPIVCFGIGYFPSRGLLMVEKFLAKYVAKSADKYNLHPLSTLAGMSYSHEIRLTQEGFDGTENLSHADPLDLALRTGFSYCQLEDWIGEAWLRRRLGEDFETFSKATGLSTRNALCRYLGEWRGENKDRDPIEHLSQGPCATMKTKIDCLLHTLDCAESEHSAKGSPASSS
jgi:hypothetical protein